MVPSPVVIFCTRGHVICCVRLFDRQKVMFMSLYYAICTGGLKKKDKFNNYFKINFETALCFTLDHH